MLRDILEDAAHERLINIESQYIPGQIDAALVGNIIFLNRAVESPHRQNRLIAHEIEHADTCPFNLLSAPASTQRKYEAIADRRAAKRLVPIERLIEIYEAGARSLDDFAEELEIDVEYLGAVLELYHSIYGYDCRVGDYMITFMPFNIKPRFGP